MEEGQRRLRHVQINVCYTRVLILVVMEEGQRHYTLGSLHLECLVLILVVMEEGQRHSAYEDVS